MPVQEGLPEEAWREPQDWNHPERTDMEVTPTLPHRVKRSAAENSVNWNSLAVDAGEHNAATKAAQILQQHGLVSVEGALADEEV